MDKKVKTHVAIVLDQSGSMEGIKKATITGYNEQVQQLKIDSKEQDIEVSLVTFNGSVFEHLWNEKAENLKEASEEDYVPVGGTALWDAWGYTVSKLMETTDHKDENVGYLVVIITDGQDNASVQYNSKRIFNLIDPLKNARWSFMVLGCSESYLRKISENTGVSLGNMASWSAATPEAASFAYSNTRQAVSNYVQCRSAGLGVKTSCLLSDTEDKCADWSTPDSTTGPDLGKLGTPVTPTIGNISVDHLPQWTQTITGPSVANNYTNLANLLKKNGGGNNVFRSKTPVSFNKK